MRAWLGRTGRGALPFAALVVAWAAVSRAGVLPEIFLPAPAEVARTAWAMLRDGSLWIDIGASLGRVLVGVVVSVPLAVGLGV
ncbi:MAG: taurine ABC transporter permease, partial [Candidatus Rokubacteria bacterium]|nr:taurine ABC transporter permease [Candidatus Rokubacteria bacterium]